MDTGRVELTEEQTKQEAYEAILAFSEFFLNELYGFINEDREGLKRNSRILIAGRVVNLIHANFCKATEKRLGFLMNTYELKEQAYFLGENSEVILAVQRDTARQIVKILDDYIEPFSSAIGVIDKVKERYGLNEV